MRPLLDCCCSRHVARKHILRLRLRLATAQSRNETLRREVEISAERLGVAEHTFQEHSERHPADQVAFRIVFSMQAKFGRWLCNTVFSFATLSRIPPSRYAAMTQQIGPRERTSLRTPSRSFVSGLVLLALRCLGFSGVWLVISPRAKMYLPVYCSASPALVR